MKKYFLCCFMSRIPISYLVIITKKYETDNKNIFTTA